MKRAVFSSCLALALALAWASNALAQPSPPEEDDAPATTAPSSPASKITTPPPLPDAPPREGQTIIVADPSPASSPAASPDRPAAEGPPRHDLVRINVGLRVGYLPVGLTGYSPSRGFDTFASNDVLSQFSIDGTYPILTSGRFVLGAGAGWDIGGRSDSVRGLESSLTVHRLYVPVEARYHLTSGLFVFGKVSPGAVAALASVKDASAPNDLTGTGWAFSADASLGGSILLGPRQHMEKRTARFWLTPEIGYAYTSNAPLRPNPNRPEKDVLGNDENTQLGKVAFSGIFWRASIGMTF